VSALCTIYKLDTTLSDTLGLAGSSQAARPGGATAGGSDPAVTGGVTEGHLASQHMEHATPGGARAPKWLLETLSLSLSLSIPTFATLANACSAFGPALHTNALRPQTAGKDERRGRAPLT